MTSSRTPGDYPVTQEQIDNAFYRYIDDHILPAPPVKTPELAYVISQPASGKSTAIGRLKKQLSSYPVIIDSDDIRSYHPQLPTIMRDDPARMDVLTNMIVGPVVSLLLDYACSNQRHVIVENTLTNHQVVRDTAEKFRDQGYRVSFTVLATAQQLSRLGIIDRYVGMNRIKGIPARWTSLYAHDKAYNTIPDNLRILHDVPDNVVVMSRSGEVFYDGGSTITAERVLNRARHTWQTPITQALYQQCFNQVSDLFTRDELAGDPAMGPLLSQVARDARRLGVSVPRSALTDKKSPIKKKGGLITQLGLDQPPVLRPSKAKPSSTTPDKTSHPKSRRHRGPSM